MSSPVLEQLGTDRLFGRRRASGALSMQALGIVPAEIANEGTVPGAEQGYCACAGHFAAASEGHPRVPPSAAMDVAIAHRDSEDWTLVNPEDHTEEEEAAAHEHALMHAA